MIEGLSGNLRNALANFTNISNKLRTVAQNTDNATSSLREFGAATGALDAVSGTAQELVDVFLNANNAATEMGILTQSVDATAAALNRFGEASGVLEKFAAAQEVAKNVVKLSSDALKAYNATKETLKSLKIVYEGIIAKVNAAKATQTVATKAHTAAQEKAKVSTSLLAKAQKALSRESIATAAAKVKNTIATKAQTAADKLKNAAIKLQTTLLAKQKAAITKLKAATTKAALVATAKKIAMGAKAIAIGVATAAKAIFNAVLKANPIMAVVAAAVALIAIGSRLVNFFRRNSRAAREQERAMENLSNTWGRTTDEIEAEMEEYGLSMEEWEAKQVSALNKVANQWGVYAGDVKDSLGDITLEEWVAQQEAALGDLSNKWGISSDDIKTALAEQGISMAEWESQQYDALQGVAAEWGMSTDEVLAQMAAQGISAEQWSAQMGQAWDDFNADVARNVSGIVNGFREIPTEFGQSAKDLRRVMDDNITATETWRENMAEIAGQVPDEMLEWLESKGPEFNSVIEEMLHTPGELDAWTDTFARATALATEQAIENIEDPALRDAIVYRLDDAGQAAAESTAIPDGMERAIKNGKKAAVAAAKSGGEETGEAYVDGVTAALEAVDFTPVVNDMDRATSRMAVNTTAAMAIIKSVTTAAMTHVKDSVYSNMSQAVINARNGLTRITAMFNGLRTSLPVSLFEAGSRAMEGMQLGMISRAPSIERTAQQIAENVTRIIRSSLRIGSPSRVLMKLGDNTMKGFAIGMERMQDRVKRVVDDTAYRVKEGLDRALAQSNLSQDMTLTLIPADSTHHSNLMERLIEAVEAGKNIIMDSGELVGATYGQIDSVSGAAISYSNRWGR